MVNNSNGINAEQTVREQLWQLAVIAFGNIFQQQTCWFKKKSLLINSSNQPGPKSRALKKLFTL